MMNIGKAIPQPQRTGVRALFCAPGRTRTYDRQIRRLLLYPLSYGGLETRRTLAVRTSSHHCSAGIAGMTLSSA
jgi:hypothetical protein